MKKILALAAALLLTFTAFAQDGKSIYNKYSDAENISAVYISPAMFRMLGKVPDIDINGQRNLTSVIRSLSGMYIISSENMRINEDMKKDVMKFVKSGKFELLMEAKDDGETVHIYTSGKGDIINSFVLLATERDETTFICLEGQLSRQQLEAIMADNLN